MADADVLLDIDCPTSSWEKAAMGNICLVIHMICTSLRRSDKSKSKYLESAPLRRKRTSLLLVYDIHNREQDMDNPRYNNFSKSYKFYPSVDTKSNSLTLLKMLNLRMSAPRDDIRREYHR